MDKSGGSVADVLYTFGCMLWGLLGVALHCRLPSFAAIEPYVVLGVDWLQATNPSIDW